MQIAITEENRDGFSKTLKLVSLDKKTIKAARANFGRFRINGVIRGGIYDSDVWTLSDDLHVSELAFSMDEDVYDRHAGAWLGCSFEVYRESVKAYIALNLGVLARSTLLTMTTLYRRLTEMDYGDVLELPAEDIPYVLELIKMMPGGSPLRDEVIESLERERLRIASTERRTLAEFKYYLRFDRELGKYWRGCPEERKIYFFPMYLWWEVTAILPLRVTEFLLTPYDCIEEKNGRFYLTIRRTKMKKGRHRVSYKVPSDYEKMQYEIPERIYNDIRWYQGIHDDAEAHGYRRPELDTLFLTSANPLSGYFCYGMARLRLRSLCAEVMNDEDYPIHLGDTRHLAMINLILSGGSPVICKELAGHESIDMSSHYYGNLSGIVESIIYEKYNGWGDDTEFSGSEKYYATLPDKTIPVEGGWCDSESMISGSVRDCFKDFDGEDVIGSCMGCRHFYPEKQGIKLRIINERKKAVDADCEYLMQMIELVRKGQGYQEDIASAMLKLHADAELYGDLLKRKYKGGYR
ncbi:site-specific integrase [Butyrivibrio sp. INlla16]|uniref:site-specific integrase n=1 Tax=Butyrivibrio sp. INlla16 TaxID=1520807 RepID=UPI00088A848D|nr:site-specific integrase [Butyrivibrio sp. INlla16]SDB12783.1 hypothetical protein SAMN02910263_00577 [Butyrivibrio sp. INlla16]SDB49690.1 hypothetical protein SAMN02910263_02460 [Butyrivibrio sp. INlla16]